MRPFDKIYRPLDDWFTELYNYAELQTLKAINKSKLREDKEWLDNILSNYDNPQLDDFNGKDYVNLLQAISDYGWTEEYMNRISNRIKLLIDISTNRVNEFDYSKIECYIYQQLSQVIEEINLELEFGYHSRFNTIQLNNIELEVIYGLYDEFIRKEKTKYVTRKLHHIRYTL